MTSTAPTALPLTDAEFDLADKIDEILESTGSIVWMTPSEIARKAETDTRAVQRILWWMVRNTSVLTSGNGTRTRYAAYTYR